MKSKNYFLAYDIEDDKRRRRVADIAYSYALGGQKSALEMVLTLADVKSLMQSIDSEIDCHRDRVHIVSVADDVILIGKAKKIKYKEGVILI